MHLKTRLFDIPRKTTLLTGSANLGENMIYSDDSLHLIRDPHLVKAFADCYEANLAGQTMENAWRDDTPVDALFSGNARGISAGARILRWIDFPNALKRKSLRTTRPVTAIDSLKIPRDKDNRAVPVVARARWRRSLRVRRYESCPG